MQQSRSITSSNKRTVLGEINATSTHLCLDNRIEPHPSSLLTQKFFFDRLKFSITFVPCKPLCLLNLLLSRAIADNAFFEGYRTIEELLPSGHQLRDGVDFSPIQWREEILEEPNSSTIIPSVPGSLEQDTLCYRYAQEPAIAFNKGRDSGKTRWSATTDRNLRLCG